MNHHRELYKFGQTESASSPLLRPGWRYALEIGVLLITLWIFTPTVHDFSPEQRLRGNEFSYLINSGVIAADILGAGGAIPLWNPFMGAGEPLVENPFSFVLNPAMTLPIVFFGPDHGPRAALLLHIAIMTLGGWLLGLMLKMNTPGRLLLGALMGGSGSMAGAIAEGFYQMSLSQAYVPWVYAGLLGTLNTRARWPVAVFVIASALLIFAGTFWYVLPTAIGAAVLVTFHVVRREGEFGSSHEGAGRHMGRPLHPTPVLDEAGGHADIPPNTYMDADAGWRVDWVGLRRVGLAALLILGLAAARLLPQAVHHDLVDHPRADLSQEFIFLIDLVPLYITHDNPNALDNPANFYHYILPLPLLLTVLIGTLFTWIIPGSAQVRWRVVIPALLLIALFTLWAMGATPITRFLYERVPLLQEWRFLARMMAAATPWLALLLALAFDGVFRRLTGSNPHPGRWILLFMLSLMGVLGASDVLSNWDRLEINQSTYSYSRGPAHYIRAANPGRFVPVMTFSFWDYLPFYEARLRASFGNPDYQPGSLPYTIGTFEALHVFPRYGLGATADEQTFLAENGYMRSDTVPGEYRFEVLLREVSPSYSFTVDSSLLVADRDFQLTRDETQPVHTYRHYIDRIAVTVESGAGDLLVVGETAYPGWTVTLNGQTADLESVGGLLGVYLPDEGQHRVVFVYDPGWYRLGAWVTIFTAVLLAVYLLAEYSPRINAGGSDRLPSFL